MKLLKFIANLLSVGWIVYGLVKHDWILVIAVISAMFGTIMFIEIKKREE